MTALCQSFCRFLDLVSPIDFTLLDISLAVQYFVITSIYKCLHDEISTNDDYLGYTFPIGSHVKTMSADDGHLESRFGSGNIILKVHHPRTLHAMFALNRLTAFIGKKLDIFPIGAYVKTMSADGSHPEFPIGTKNIKFCRFPSNDHSCNVCFELVYWFQRKNFVNISHRVLC